MIDNSVARILLQRLESLERAGLTHLPRLAEPPEPQPISRPSENGVPADDVLTEEGLAEKTPVEKTPAEKTPAEKTPADTVAKTTACNEATEVTARKKSSDRQAELDSLRVKVAACTRCRELAEARKQTVFGAGNPRARLVFLGEAPGADEDREGIPFVGRAGQLLTKIIEACTLSRDDVYILNILKCRPPGNRNPEPDESANCREYLDAQLAVIQPEFIVCLGAVAARNLLDTEATIGNMRGKFYLYNGIRVLCTYHPAYLLRNPAAKRDVWEDMQLLMAEMGIELPRK